MSEAPGAGAWQEYIDPKTGCKYYANSVTNEVTWTCPEELKKQAPVPPPQNPEWVRHVDKRTNKYYFQNIKSNETTWSAPPFFIEAADYYQMLLAQQQQKVATGSPHTSPRPQADAPAPSSNSSEAKAPDTGSVNSKYARHLDPKTGHYYYVNLATQAVQWEMPEGYQVPVPVPAPLPQGPAPLSPPVLNSGFPRDFRAGSSADLLKQSQNQTMPQAYRPAPILSAPSFQQMQESKQAKYKSLPAAMPEHQPSSGGSSSEQESVKLPNPLREDILRFQLHGYAEEHFRTVKKRKGFFKKIVPVDSLLQWQKDNISKSLLQQTKNMNTVALQSFKNIQSFMGDRESQKSPEAVARLIVSTGETKPAVRDEIYCQLCKQTSHNPSPQSTLQGWKLLALCTAAFPPSRNFEGFLLNYFSQHFHADGDVKHLAGFCYFRLEKTLKFGAEPMNPGEVENMLKKGVPSHKVAFGGSLEYMMALQRLEGNKDAVVPVVLIKLCDLITKLGGHKARGIFRVAADKDETDALRRAIEEKGDYEMKSHNPHVPGDVLKIWLRNLSEPLVPTSLYQECLRVSEKPVEALALLRKSLPPAHFNVMNYLMIFLKQLASCSKDTSMTAENLAIVFSQNILRQSTQDDDGPQPSLDRLKNSDKETQFIASSIAKWPDNLEYMPLSS